MQATRSTAPTSVDHQRHLRLLFLTTDFTDFTDEVWNGKALLVSHKRMESKEAIHVSALERLASGVKVCVTSLTRGWRGAREWARNLSYLIRGIREIRG